MYRRHNDSDRYAVANRRISSFCPGYESDQIAEQHAIQSPPKKLGFLSVELQLVGAAKEAQAEKLRSSPGEHLYLGTEKQAQCTLHPHSQLYCAHEQHFLYILATGQPHAEYERT
jgi:hypothetical protein